MSYSKKQAMEKFSMYLSSNMTSLSDAYKSFRARKKSAWNYCVGLMAELEGNNLKVITYTGYIFTAGFLFIDKDGDPCYMHITPSYDQAIKISEVKS